MNENSSMNSTKKSVFTSRSAWSQQETSRVLQASWIAQDGTLYASSFSTIYKSVDGGMTCEELKSFDCNGLESIHVNKENTEVQILVHPGPKFILIQKPDIYMTSQSIKLTTTSTPP